MNLSLENKIILVTGASGTLGHLICKSLRAEGAVVFGTYCHHHDKIIDLQQQGVSTIKMDLGNKDLIKQTIVEIIHSRGRIDGLVNNAAYIDDALIMNMKEEQWDKVIEINVTGSFYLLKETCKHMMKQRQGRIVNILSRVGFKGAYGQANYSAAKGALSALTKTCAKEMGRYKVLVNGICPGFFQSAMTEHVPEIVRQKAKQQSPLGEFSTGNEVADITAYLLSDRNKGITGQILTVDSRI